MGNHDKIPSVISYSPATNAREQQWGIDLSAEAVAMVYTKLELDLQSVDGELDLLLQAMDGMQDLHFDNIRKQGPLPAYTSKSAEKVVTDYLSRIFEHLSNALQIFPEELKDDLPVDIVVTVPTVGQSRSQGSQERF